MMTHLHVLSMSAPYESAKPISLSQMRSVQVSMLGRGYSTIVCKIRNVKTLNKLFGKFQNVSQRIKKKLTFLYYMFKKRQ
jgi:hypothetical protein